MPANPRQLGCVCVTPTLFAQDCADAGKSFRLVVGPWNTIRTVAALTVGDGDVGGLESPQPACAVNTTSTMIRRQFIVVTACQIVAISMCAVISSANRK